MRHFGLLLMLAAMLGGCHVPPRASDPSLLNQPIAVEYLLPPSPPGHVRLRVATIGGAPMPPRALAAAVATIERHLGRRIEVIVDDPWNLAEPDSPVHEFAEVFPIRENGRVLNEGDLKPGRGGMLEHLLAHPDNGIIGAVGLPVSSDANGMVSWHEVTPIVEPGVILVVVVPGAKDGSGHTGYVTLVASDRAGSMKDGLIVLRQRAIKEHANLFVSADKLWQWTLTHEIGHILNVPSSNSHQWIVPGIPGVHCTHPECVMYTGLDWRVVVSGLLHGWPLDFCEVCSAELREARERATGQPESAP